MVRKLRIEPLRIAVFVSVALFPLAYTANNKPQLTNPETKPDYKRQSKVVTMLSLIRREQAKAANKPSNQVKKTNKSKMTLFKHCSKERCFQFKRVSQSKYEKRNNTTMIKQEKYNSWYSTGRSSALEQTGNILSKVAIVTVLIVSIRYAFKKLRSRWFKRKKIKQEIQKSNMVVV